MLRIMMLGPALYVKGGVSSIERLMVKYSDNDCLIEMLPTMHDRSLFGRFRHLVARLMTWPIRSVYNRPDIVHIHMSHGLSTWRKLLLLRLWKISRVRVFLHMHSSMFKTFFPSLPSFLRWWVSRGFRKADRIIVLSESWKEYYSSISGVTDEKILVMPTPVEIPEEIGVVEHQGRTIVLFSGRVGSRKGVFDLINAWSKLPEETLEKSTLVIAGDGETGKARKMVESLGDLSEIDVVGWVSDEELRQLLAKSSVYVLPSKNEGLPMGMMEAMAHGNAIITCPVGGIPEFIIDGENGIFVQPGSVEELTNALQKVLTDDKLRDYLSIQSRKSIDSKEIGKYMVKLKNHWTSIE